MADVVISARSAHLLHQLAEGMRRVAGDTRTEAELVDDAVVRIHRGFYGLPPSEGGPQVTTGPFRKWASDRRAEVLLRQVDPTTFRLAQPFRYDDGRRCFTVPEGDVTDLASVPSFLTWLVPRYGRHTLAALLHDHLQHQPGVSSEEADEIFRDAMADTGVPVVRRWLMWSAVALRTQWNLGGPAQLRAGLYAFVYAVGGAVIWPALALATALGWQSAATRALIVGAVVVSPLVACWLWGRHWRLGLLAGLALLAVSFPVVLVIAVGSAYLASEWVVERCQPAPRRNPVLTRNLKRHRRSKLAAEPWSTP